MGEFTTACVTLQRSNLHFCEVSLRSLSLSPDPGSRSRSVVAEVAFLPSSSNLG